MNQRWQIDVESTWISRCPTSRRYFNIYQRWINVECLLGCIQSECGKIRTRKTANMYTFHAVNSIIKHFSGWEMSKELNNIGHKIYAKQNSHERLYATLILKCCNALHPSCWHWWLQVWPTSWRFCKFRYSLVFLSCHMTALRESSSWSCLNVKDLFAGNKHDIWNLNDCNWAQTCNYLVHSQKLNQLPKLPQLNWSILQCLSANSTIVRSNLVAVTTIRLATSLGTENWPTRR